MFSEGDFILDPDAGFEMFARTCRNLLGEDPITFLINYYNGKYDNLPDTVDGRRIERVTYSIPFVEEWMRKALDKSQGLV